MSSSKTRDLFQTHLTTALKNYIDQCADQLIEECKALVEKNIRMHVAQMAVRISREALIERKGEELLIRVKFDDQEEPEKERGNA